MNLRLVDAHEREAERHNAEFFNLGWGMSDTTIESKTDKGILLTRIRDGKIEHKWMNQ
jgi:hypothetical protein